MELTLSSGLLSRGIFTGSYQTIIGDLDILDDCRKDFENCIMETYKELMEEALEENDITCTVTPIEIDRPSYYNYRDDYVVFKISLPNDFIDSLKRIADCTEFINFIEEEYKSYSGFISFMPNSKEKFEKAIEDDIERATSAYLNFLLIASEVELQDDFIEKVSDTAYSYGWVIDEEDYKEDVE